MLILTRGKHGISWRGGSRQAHFHVRESKSRLCGAYGFRRDDEPVPQMGGNLYVSFKQEGWTKACAGVSASYRVGLVSSHRPHARAPVVGDVLRGVMRVLACQMRGSRTRRQEETPKLLSPLRRSDARRLSIFVYVIGQLLTPLDGLPPCMVSSCDIPCFYQFPRSNLDLLRDFTPSIAPRSRRNTHWIIFGYGGGCGGFGIDWIDRIDGTLTPTRTLPVWAIGVGFGLLWAPL